MFACATAFTSDVDDSLAISLPQAAVTTAWSSLCVQSVLSSAKAAEHRVRARARAAICVRLYRIAQTRTGIHHRSSAARSHSPASAAAAYVERQ
jgi:hypothetical protein